MQGDIKTPCFSYLNHGEKKTMSNNLRDIIDSIQRQLFYIYFRLAPRDRRFYQAVKIFGEITDFSASLQYMALPNVDEKDGGKISAQQLEDMTGGWNIILKNTSLDDLVEWCTIETFGIIADKFDKHYFELSAPDCFSQFIELAGRSLFKKALKYLIVKTLNTTRYQIEGGSVLYIETCDDFLALYFFVKNSRKPYIKARLIG